MTDRERFLEIYRQNITREGADKLLDWLESADFFTAPASTRYHGAEEGGLLSHSLGVYDCLVSHLERRGEREKFSEETIAIAALLHDICKVNFYKIGYRNVKENGGWVRKEVYEIDEKFPCGHGEKSVIILQNFMRLTTDEILAIRAHMGGFDTSVKGGDYMISRIFERCELAVLLHMADMEASYLNEGRG